MTLTKQEKDFLVEILKEKLEQIKVDDNFGNMPVNLISGEIKYEEFLNQLIKKLK